MRPALHSHESWRLDREDLTLPPVHTPMGTVPPAELSPYHLEFANIELARSLPYYESRVRAIGFTGLGRVLDAACGVGQWSVALGLHNAEVHGIDRAEERLALGERLVRAQSLSNVHFTHGDVEALPYPDEWFDAIFCYGVFMFLDAEIAMRELARVLRIGGRLYVSANGLGWSVLLIVRRRLVEAGTETIRRTFRGIPRDNFLTRRRMRTLLHEHGLRLRAWGGEGRLRAPGAPREPRPAPVYPSRYLGMTCVWELLADKVGPGRTSNALADVEPPVLAHFKQDALRFEEARRAVPAELRHVHPPASGAVSEEEYRPDKLADVRSRLRGIDPDAYLRALSARIVEGAVTEHDAVERIIRFVQDAFFHNPIHQPPVELPVFELIHLGEGRCGHVTRVAVDLLTRAGFAARSRQLPRHIVAEVFLDGDWRAVDADAFKNGVIPKNRDGRLLSLRELEINPYQLDRFPPTGLWIRARSRYATNVAGERVEGYVDAIDQEDRGYMSWHYVASAEQEYPPSVPRLRPQPDTPLLPARVRLEWEPSTDRDGDLRGYRVRVGTSSKGWSFDDAEYERLTCVTGAELGEFETTGNSLELTFEKPGLYYWSVAAFDAHVLREPETFYWSSDEDSFRVGDPSSVAASSRPDAPFVKEPSATSTGKR